MKAAQLQLPHSTPWPANVVDALRDLQAALRRLYGLRAPTLLLYGSYAREEASDASDVDVLLLYPDRVSAGSEIQRLGATLADLNLRYQVLISVLPAHQQDLQTGKSAFWDNIRREAIVLD